MDKIRVGVVGVGSRGRSMMKLLALFDCVQIAAACDIRKENWFEQQWKSPAPFS